MNTPGKRTAYRQNIGSITAQISLAALEKLNAYAQYLYIKDPEVGREEEEKS